MFKIATLFRGFHSRLLYLRTFYATFIVQFLGQFYLEDEHELESRIVTIIYILADDVLFVSSRYCILRVWR